MHSTHIVLRGYLLHYTTYGNEESIVISRTLSFFEKLQNKFVIYMNT